MTARIVRTRAPAKVNLVLRIGAQRDDGFHEVETLFQAVSLFDEVEVSLDPTGRGLALHVDGPDLGPPESNLAWRAAEAFRAVRPFAGRVEIRLSKRIPAGAGLGGGSSDAAAVLRCLAVLVGDDALERDRRTGADLGSDVPFFVGPAALAWGRGRGERLTAVPSMEPRALLLALPPVHVGTAGAYRALAESRVGRPSGRRPALPATPGWDEVMAMAENDFEPVVSAAHPEIRASLDAMRDAGARCALLSGSGAASFGLYSSEADLAGIGAELESRLGWPFAAVRTLESLPPVREGRGAGRRG